MEKNKWPILAQILIALGCLSGGRVVIEGFMRGDMGQILIGALVLCVFVYLYQFKLWALKALSVMLSIYIVLMVMAILGGVPIFVCIFFMAVCGFMIYYFNSEKIKSLF